jgi:2-polyprenyl-6-methoxyphenol hydroxylase-like FAD-dependent oxidoreductase
LTRIALIVGAGIGGLAAGVALRRAGWTVRIFERAASPRELGFGLALAPNAIAALRELGVADLVLARAFAPSLARLEVRRMDGTVLKRAEIPPHAALGGPMAIALRPVLHGALLDAVGLDAIALGNKATGFTATRHRVTLHMANGDVADGDLLVGADGTESVIRAALHPAEPAARSSGLVAVRGAVHGATHHLGDLGGIYYLDPGVESAIVRAGNGGIYWFVSLACKLAPPGVRDPAAIIAHVSPRFDATFRAITSSTDDLRFDELFDRDPISDWGTGAVTLLGDAAHPMLPHTGQGAAQAIVDAVTLGRVLSGDAAIEPALRAYERERQPRTAALVRQGRRTARIMRNTNPIVCAIRELVVRMIPVRTFVKIVVRINRRAGTDTAP